MDIEIKKNGQRHTLNDFGFKVTNVTVESIEKRITRKIQVVVFF